MTTLDVLFERWSAGAPEGELLEFGSGSDFPCSRLLRRYFRRCSATDIVEVPRWLWPDDLEFRRCGDTTLPFEDERFDVVVIRSVVEHLREPGAMFRELSRVLKPGGRILMNVPNKWDYVSVIARLVGRAKSSVLRKMIKVVWEDFPVFYRCNTPRQLRRVLAGSGLVIEVLRPLPSEPSYLKFFVPLYLVGAIYQFGISILSLDMLQPSFVVILRKAKVPRDAEGA